MSKSSAFTAACLTASLATAWVAPDAKADEYRVSASLTSITGFSHLTLMTGDLSVAGAGGAIAVPDDSSGSSILVGGGVHVAGTLFLGGGTKLTNFEVAGLYTDMSTGAPIDHAVFGFSTPNGVVGIPFESVFKTTTSEQQVISLIKGTGRGVSADARDLQTFLASAGVSPFTALDSPASLVQFSNGVSAGSLTVSVEAIPEPSTFAILLAGAATFLRRARKLRW